MATETDKLLLTVPEAAAKLNIGKTTLYSLMDAGKIRTVTIGRARRFHPDALRDYVATLTGSVQAQ